MEKKGLSSITEAPQQTLTWSDTISPQSTTRSKLETPRLRQPWRHSVSWPGLGSPTHTVREFKPDRQRQRLFIVGIWQWFLTSLLCGLLAASLGTFGNLLAMTVTQVKGFNALIVLLSLLLGNNLTSSLREYALMLRWRLLASKYRSLQEFDLIMRCDSLRKVLKLFWVARTQGAPWFWLNRAQYLCILWLAVNILLQVLVALLGLTYNLNTSPVPQRRFGAISVADLSAVRDVWGADSPSFDDQLGSANYFGIQGQDYLFVNATPPGQDNIPAYGSPGTSTVYANNEWNVMTYVFIDQSLKNTDLTLTSHRNMTATATCRRMPVVTGGNGTIASITYIDDNGKPITLDVVRVGPGATTYIGMLNSTCGPRCTEVMALQSSNNGTIPEPLFFKCNSTLSTVTGIEEYLFDGQTIDAFQMPDKQAQILAGAIGWSGFNYTQGDEYQYVRYNTGSWWSPTTPATHQIMAKRIMEFSIEAVAAIDYNGPRNNVSGWYPITAQVVSVQWRWAATILGLLPFFQFLALVCVIARANHAIIRDDSCLSNARLLRPLVEKLGDRGCILTGEEIAEEMSSMRIMYGWREPASALVFRNDLGDDTIRHVDILEEKEGLGLQGAMPAGRYDGLYAEDTQESSTDDHRGRLRRRTNCAKRSTSL